MGWIEVGEDSSSPAFAVSYLVALYLLQLFLLG